MELKDWVLDNLFRVDRTLIPARVKPWKTGRLSWFELNYPTEFKMVNDLPGNSFNEKLFRLINNKDQPKCNCGNDVTFNTIQKGYYQFCSVICANSDNELNIIKVTNKRNNGGFISASIASKKTLQDRYGNEVKSSFQIPAVKEKIKENCLIKYGVDNAAKSQEVFDKMKQTNLDRYGFGWAIQNKEICDKAFQNGAGRSKVKWFNKDIWYQGGNEFRFLESISNISRVERGPTIKYNSFGENTNYFSDFIIGNSLYEIKSLWTWNNKGKDKLLRIKNKLKLRAAKRLGYEVFLVLDGIHYSYSEIIKMK